MKCMDLLDRDETLALNDPLRASKTRSLRQIQYLARTACLSETDFLFRRLLYFEIAPGWF